MNIFRSLKHEISEVLKFPVRHPKIFTGAAVTSGVVWATLSPWLAIPVIGSTILNSLAAGQYRDFKKNIEANMPEGEVWQRKDRMQISMARFLSVGASIAAPLVLIGNGYLNRTYLDGLKQIEIANYVSAEDTAGKIQRNVPFDVPGTDKQSIQLVITDIQPSSNSDNNKMYLGEAQFNIPPIFKRGEPVRQTQEVTLIPRRVPLPLPPFN